jgi:cysteine-rich repeat protein
MAGTGGMTSTNCGNGKMDAGEECDDGNTVDFDGCSSTCESKCEACLVELYGDDAEYQFMLDQCKNSMIPAAANGPAAGQLRSTLCLKLVKCMRTSGCAEAAGAPLRQGLLESCYCGIGTTDCDTGGPDNMGNPVGACRKEVENAAESKSPSEVSVRFTTPELASGFADFLVRAEAYSGYCAEACTQRLPVDDCTRCAAGDMHDYGLTQAVCPIGFNLTETSAPLSRCVRAHCAANDQQPCFEAAGPCAAQLKDLTATTLANTKEDLNCRAANCAAECFKP